MADIVLVAGARPNYPKVAPLYAALVAAGPSVCLVDTGQHYDAALAQEMREDLGLPDPHIQLGVGSGSHASQTAAVMAAFEGVLTAEHPACVVVVGDVNSTLACALVTVKAWDDHGRRPLLAHVEAGLRSYDRAMPEEINRVVTDALADVLFTTERKARANLELEHVRPDRIHFVGNVMVDALLAYTQTLPPVTDRPHIVVTLHRPATVDRPRLLAGVMGALEAIGAETDLPVLLVCHPRTQRRLGHGADDHWPHVTLLPPLRYRRFIDLVRSARLVLTDSGGLQEETTVLGVPCLTVRETTERPITLRGTNRVVGVDPDHILAAARMALARPPAGHVPPLWDGHAAPRIAAVLQRLVGQ